MYVSIFDLIFGYYQIRVPKLCFTVSFPEFYEDNNKFEFKTAIFPTLISSLLVTK